MACLAPPGAAHTQIAEEGASIGFSLRASPCSDALAFLGALVLDAMAIHSASDERLDTKIFMRETRVDFGGMSHT